MSLKAMRNLIFITGGMALLLGVSSVFVKSETQLILAIAFVVIGLIISLLFFRCPKCGKRVSFHYFEKSCTGCGEDLDL